MVGHDNEELHPTGMWYYVHYANLLRPYSSTSLGQDPLKMSNLWDNAISWGLLPLSTRMYLNEYSYTMYFMYCQPAHCTTTTMYCHFGWKGLELLVLNFLVILAITIQCSLLGKVLLQQASINKWAPKIFKIFTLKVLRVKSILSQCQIHFFVPRVNQLISGGQYQGQKVISLFRIQKHCENTLW